MYTHVCTTSHALACPWDMLRLSSPSQHLCSPGTHGPATLNLILPSSSQGPVLVPAPLTGQLSQLSAGGFACSSDTLQSPRAQNRMKPSRCIKESALLPSVMPLTGASLVLIPQVTLRAASSQPARSPLALSCLPGLSPSACFPSSLPEAAQSWSSPRLLFTSVMACICMHLSYGDAFAVTPQ